MIDYYKRRPADTTQKRLFTLLICFMLAALSSDLIFAFVNGIPGDIFRTVNWFACSLYFLLTTVAFSFVVLLFEHTLNEDTTRLKRTATLLAVVNAVHFALHIWNAFSYRLFYITHDNLYARGDLYMFLFVIPNMLILFMFLIIVMNRKSLKRTLFVLALVSSLPIVAGAAIDIFWEESLLTWPSFFISLLFFYLFIIRMTALIDSLTNVYNRRGFDEYLLSIDKSASRKEYVFILADLDKFKEVNDRFGHAQGDAALRDTAKILRSSVRHSDFVARYGGDEFIIIAQSNNVNIIIDKIQLNVEKYNTTQTKPYKLALSCGGDIFLPNDNRTPSEFMAHVDSLMYSEKERRR